MWGEFLNQTNTDWFPQVTQVQWFIIIFIYLLLMILPDDSQSKIFEECEEIIILWGIFYSEWFISTKIMQDMTFMAHSIRDIIMGE